MKITMKFQQIFENFVGIGANRIRQKIDLLVCDLKTLENVQLTSKIMKKMNVQRQICKQKFFNPIATTKLISLDRNKEIIITITTVVKKSQQTK